MVLSEEDGGESSEDVNIVYKVGDLVIYNGEITGFTDANAIVTLVGQVRRELLLFYFLFIFMT